MKDQIKSLVLQNTFLPPSVPHGWGNGYVGVPPGHPWHGVDHMSIDCSVHGGLTYGTDHAPNFEPDGFYWVGFDTAHYQDNAVTCPKEYVEAETENLKQQAINVCP